MLRARFRFPCASLVRASLFGSSLLAGATLLPVQVLGQGQKQESIKVNLPPTPNFDAATGPLQHPTGEYTVFGLRKQMTKVLDKDVMVKGHLLYLYECPPEVRKCNDEADAKAKKEKRKAAKGAPPPDRRASRRRLPPLRTAPLLHQRFAQRQAGAGPAGGRLPDEGLEDRQAQAADREAG